MQRIEDDKINRIVSITRLDADIDIKLLKEQLTSILEEYCQPNKHY